MNRETLFRQYTDAVENNMREYFRNRKQLPQDQLFQAMQYSLLAGGKRLRPILVCEFARISGANWEKSIPLACAIEMVHTYSLIHDDLPCMDNDDYRRGRLTNHKVYGDALAVLAGDALLTDAFCCIAEAPLGDPALNTAAVLSLSQAAGSLGMVGGQVLDILSEQRECSEREVLDIQSRKTGCLIRAACELGVITAGAKPEQLKAARAFADNLGLAFQIRDDMLDVIGDAAEMGKATGADQNKNTFVRLYGLDYCEKLVQKYTEAAVSSLEVFSSTEILVDFARALTGRKA